MGQIFFAGKEPQECSALLRVMIADRSPQHRIASLNGIEHRALRRWLSNFNLYLVPNMGQST
jgi:hypothetical protein